MSQPWQQQPNSGSGQPPQPQPQPGAYGQPPQQQPGYGYPSQPTGPMPGAQPQQPFGAPGGGYPAPTPPPTPQGGGNVLAAVGAAIGAMLVCAFLYALVMQAMYDEETGEFTQIGYLAVLVGVAIAAGPAFLAKRNWTLAGVAAVLSLLAVIIGQLYGVAMVMSDLLADAPPQTTPAQVEEMLGVSASPGDSAFAVFFGDLGGLIDVWNEGMGALDYLFVLLAPAGALAFSYRMFQRAGTH